MGGTKVEPFGAGLPTCGIGTPVPLPSVWPLICLSGTPTGRGCTGTSEAWPRIIGRSKLTREGRYSRESAGMAGSLGPLAAMGLPRPMPVEVVAGGGAE